MERFGTIAAIATAPGRAGIACVRVSGPEAAAVADRVFLPENPARTVAAAAGYTALFGRFVRAGRKLDEAVALRFRAPKSYTGEDVVEITVHGGEEVVSELLAACIEAGARPAAAGEFTRRALLNGRISLTQAEAVAGMIESESESGVRAAAAAMGGALHRQITALAEQLRTLAGHIAAVTDFPEEDVEELNAAEAETTIGDAAAQLKKLLDGYDAGSILRRGVRTAIVGSPNVGKSTLLNLMSGCEKAIVTPYAGTTRDLVEQDIRFGGTVLHLADTAGIRSTPDPVEAEGIRRSREALAQANLVLAVFDASSPLSEDDLALAEQCRGKLAIAIFNKTDLPSAADPEQVRDCFRRTVFLSALQDGFSATLREAISETVGSSGVSPDDAMLANERQRSAALRAQSALQDAQRALADGLALDAVSVCIDDALDALYELTGQSVSEAVLDDVFSHFCVGK